MCSTADLQKTHLFSVPFVACSVLLFIFVFLNIYNTQLLIVILVILCKKKNIKKKKKSKSAVFQPE